MEEEDLNKTPDHSASRHQIVQALGHQEGVSSFSGIKISLDYAKTDKYPQAAREMLEGTTEEEVKRVIEGQANFSEPEFWYVNGLDESGKPNLLSGEKDQRTIGLVRLNYLTIKDNPGENIKINANVRLLHLYGEEPKIIVDLYASKINYDYPHWMPEDGGDGQCLSCQGWGCWDCGFGGGY